eukprot:GDKI01049271.1.p1 GENE.GDKI01049271.1~~GDKI01049271.1.p1  ORF type:complete len:157 (+),score=60.50 GDKI01049271.1:74-544(+)
MHLHPPHTHTRMHTLTSAHTTSNIFTFKLQLVCTQTLMRVCMREIVCAYVCACELARLSVWKGEEGSASICKMCARVCVYVNVSVCVSVFMGRCLRAYAYVHLVYVCVYACQTTPVGHSGHVTHTRSCVCVVYAGVLMHMRALVWMFQCRCARMRH